MKTLTRSRKVCLAQLAGEEATNERESGRERNRESEQATESEDANAGWLQADPFQSQPMRRLSVGRTRMGKTVGAQAAASRVLGAYPHARVVIFTPIPGSYDRLADLLTTNAGPNSDVPRVERVHPTDFSANSESPSELPAVSVVTPSESGDCTTLARAFTRFADHLRGAEIDESDPPVYLIVDGADQLFSASESTDLLDFMRATRDDSIAIHALAQRTEVEPEHPFPEHYTEIDLYRKTGIENPGWQRRRGVSEDDAASFDQQAHGPRRLSTASESERPESAWTLARRAAPTGLCYTQNEGWSRVRYTLFSSELKALATSSSSSERESLLVNENGETRL